MSAFTKDILRQIYKTLPKFLSILVLIILGVSFYVGISSTAPDMTVTGENYFKKTNFYDIKLLSTLGFSDKDVREISKTSGIKCVDPVRSTDVLVNMKDKRKSAFKVYSTDQSLAKVQNSGVNIPQIVKGEYPKKNNECLIDSRYMNDDNFSIGKTITIDFGNIQGDKNPLLFKKYVVTGFVHSPLYISEDRGTTKIGDGKLSGFMFIPKSSWNMDYYTEIYLTIQTDKPDSIFENAHYDKVKPIIESLKVLGKTRANTRYDEVLSDSQEKINSVKNKISDGKNQLADAQKKLTDGEQQINDGEVKLEEGKQKLTEKSTNAKRQLANAKTKLNDTRLLIDSSEKNLSDGWIQLKASKMKLGKGKKQVSQGENGLKELKKNLDLLKAKVQSMEGEQQALIALKSQLETLEEKKKNLPKGNTSLDGEISETATKISAIENSLKLYPLIKAKYDLLLAQYNKTFTTIELVKSEIAANEKKINDAEQSLIAGQKELEKGKQEYSNGFAQYNSRNSLFINAQQAAQKQIDEAAQKLGDKRTELTNGKQEFQDNKAKALGKIADAEKKLEDAEKQLADIKNPQWYITDYNLNTGFSNYKAHIQSLRAIGSILPVIFFLVAALICLNAMTRMVEHDRGTIGTFSALGYSNFKISQKYIIYALSASIFGIILGLFVGFNLFPNLIFSSYTMVYTAFPPIEVHVNLWYAICAIIFSIACSTGSTIVVCVRELHTMPSELMRPKAPKVGKRILLESMPFIWNKFSFINKVTARNIFRYKKRFIMTIVGISGCTALLFTGFGLRDSISAISDKQFGELKPYREEATIKNEIPFSKTSELRNFIKQDRNVKDSLFVRQEALSISTSSGIKSAYLVVGEPKRKLDGFIKLKKINSDEIIPLSDNGVVITEKLANITNTHVGGTISFTNADNDEYKVKVIGIVENYLYNNIYFTSAMYKSVFNKEAMYNGFFIKTINKAKSAETSTAEYLLGNKKIGNVSLESSVIDILADIVNNLIFIVIVLIVSAALLAFAVLFNLNSINLEERTYELATLKVLGFLDNEAKAYIFRENIILTGVGGGLGLLLGILLHRIILTAMEVDIMMYWRGVNISSFIISFLLTLAFAYIVNLLMGRKISRIDLVQSLKSVD